MTEESESTDTDELTIDGELEINPSPQMNFNPQDIEPEIHISEDGLDVKLKGDAESFTVEKDGEEVEINFQDGEWHIAGDNEDRDTCSHRYCENWADECEKHD